MSAYMIERPPFRDVRHALQAAYAFEELEIASNSAAAFASLLGSTVSVGRGLSKAEKVAQGAMVRALMRRELPRIEFALLEALYTRPDHGRSDAPHPARARVAEELGALTKRLRKLERVLERVEADEQVALISEEMDELEAQLRELRRVQQKIAAEQTPPGPLTRRKVRAAALVARELAADPVCRRVPRRVILEQVLHIGGLTIASTRAQARRYGKTERTVEQWRQRVRAAVADVEARAQQRLALPLVTNHCIDAH